MRVDQTAGQLDMLLLAALAQGPVYGYGVIARLRADSGGVFAMPEGTIYPALHRLEQAGLVESSVETAQGRRRRTYALTPRGRKEFTSQRREWQSFVARMQAVIA